MSVNFPRNRAEAGIPGGGSLQVGDLWRYNQVQYIVIRLTDDGEPAWSGKGFNVNPDDYISKAEDFNNNAGVISGAYSGNNFAVSYATTAGDADTLDTFDSDHFLNASNLNAGTIHDDRLPNNITAKVSDSDKLNGQQASYYRDAGNLNSGTISDDRLPNTISSDISGTSADSSKLNGQGSDYYTNASNLSAGTISDERLPSNISSNTSGNAATADEADKVVGTLTLNFVDAEGVTTTTTYDGSTATEFTFTDTDAAQQVLTLTGGKGIDVTGSEIKVRNTVARGYGGYVTNHDYADGSNPTTYLKVKEADTAGNSAMLNSQLPGYYLNYNNLDNKPDLSSLRVSYATNAGSASNADKLDGNDGSYYLDYNNFRNTPGAPPTYSAGVGINISSNNAISINSGVARTSNVSNRSTSSYVVDGSDRKLRCGRADSVANSLTITVNGTEYSYNGSNATNISITSGGGNSDTADFSRASRDITPAQSDYVSNGAYYNTTDQGTYIVWNPKVKYSNSPVVNRVGNGSTCFINNPGSGSGGWRFMSRRGVTKAYVHQDTGDIYVVGDTNENLDVPVPDDNNKLVTKAEVAAMISEALRGY